MARIISEAKDFKKGGLDTDSSLDDVAQNDVIASFNIRNTGTGEEEDSDESNIEGTNLISSPLNSGLNKCIGAAGFPTIRKGYAFIYNSQGNWQLKEFDFDAQIETVIFTNKTDSGGVSVFDLDPQYYINDIKLIQDRYLCFTDGNTPPHYLDLVRLKNGSYGVIKTEDFSLIKGQPIKEPTYVYNNDSSRSVNLLKNRLFQFREQFQKLDNELTAWSTISKRVVPTDEPTPAVGTNVTIANNLIVSVDAGTDRDFKLNIAARYDLLDWFLVKSINRSTVIALPNTSVDVANQIYEAYDPVTNIYSFAFYNDGLYNNISVLETDLPYDYVPNKASSLEVINGSILALANLTEGYDRPTADVTISTSSYNPNITNPSTESNPLRGVITDHYRLSNRSYYRIVLQFAGLPKTGDKILIQTRSQVDSDAPPVNYSITVLSTEQDNLQAVLNRLATIIPNSVTDGIIFVFETQGYNRFDISFLTFDLANAGTGDSKSISSIKTNSSYQLALAWYDANGKYFPILSDERFVIKTQSYALTHGLIPQINWNLNASIPPVGAVSYQWLISENNTHARWLDINGTYVDSRSDADYLVFNIKSLFNFNETNSSSILNYEYSEGDRVTLYFTFLDTNVPIKWFDSPAIDVEVVGFEIVVDNTVPTNPITNQYLKVRKSSTLDIVDINGKEVLMEIYSPKKRVIVNTDGTTTETSTLFYEIGVRYDIVNGDYSVKQGIIREADSYFKTRNLTGTIDSNKPYVLQLEDPNFSDFYKSNYYSFGRPRIYDDEQGQVNKKASIRYSDTFITGSKVNGITRFYGERIYGDGAGETSSNYGGIGKIRMRDNYLICLQELKIGHIPVNISIIEDQAEQRQVAVSDKLLNFVRYLPGNFGIGLAVESYGESQNGTVYFADPNNSLPIRDGYDGVSVISVKMTKYFRRVLKQAKAEGLKIIGWYDNFNEEYNLSIETKSGVVTNFTFNDGDWEYKDNYVLTPSTDFVINTSTNGITVYNGDGTATFTPTTDFVGNGGFNFDFLGGTVNKNACITVVAGNITPTPYYFVDLIDQPTSTLLVSNAVLINGIDIAAPISVVGGEISINGGAWSSAPTTVVNGDSVRVRQTSSSSNEVTTSATVTVGGYSDSFDVTTAAAIETVQLQIVIFDSYQNAYYNVDDSRLAAVRFSLVGGGEYLFTITEDIVRDNIIHTFNIPASVFTANVDNITSYLTTGTGITAGDDIVTTVYQNYVSLGEHVQNRMTDPPIAPGFEYQGAVPTNAPTGIVIAAGDVIKIENKGVLAPTAVGILVIDLYNDTTLDVCAFCDTVGVEPYQMPIYRVTNNFLPNDGTPTANCWGLASDLVTTGGSLVYRFEFNLARLINSYPAIPDFNFKVRGRAASAGSLSGAYSKKGAESGSMIMTGTAGSYVPSTQNTTDLGIVSYSGKPYGGGGNGNIGLAYGSDILEFNYNVATNTLTLL